MDCVFPEGSREKWNMGRAWCGLDVGAGEGGPQSPHLSAFEMLELADRAQCWDV